MQEQTHITIFQVNIERDEDRVCFLGISGLNALRKEIKPEAYDKVWEGDIPYTNFDDLFFTFNFDLPAGYHGRSMSVSDIIRIQCEDNEPEFWFCDNFGFKQIDFEPFGEV